MSSAGKSSSRAVTMATARPPDGGWGWWVVVASFGCNFVVDGIAYSFGVLINELSESYSATRAHTSLAGSLLCGMYLLNGELLIATSPLEKFTYTEQIRNAHTHSIYECGPATAYYFHANVRATYFRAFVRTFENKWLEHSA